MAMILCGNHSYQEAQIRKLVRMVLGPSVDEGKDLSQASDCGRYFSVLPVVSINIPEIS